jgi:hypothetical protein
MDLAPPVAVEIARSVDPTLRLPRGGGRFCCRRPQQRAPCHRFGDCIAQEGPLGRLADDLKTNRTTPVYAFAPDLCDSGTLADCPDGLAGADAFLRTWAPRILASPAYRHDGALLVLFLARAPGTGTATAPTHGLVVSRFARAGATLKGAYDPYGALRSIEDLLGLDPLGFAAQAKAFTHDALPGAFAR